MTETWYPSSAHNSTDVTDVEYEKLAINYAMSGLIGVPGGTQLAFGDSSGRVLKWRANMPAMVRGGIWVSDAVISLDVDANTSGSTRFDLGVLRLDRGADGGPTVNATLIKGTPGSGVPSPVQDDPGAGRWDLPVSSVKVANGALTIAAADVLPVAPYLGEPVYACTSTSRPLHRYGRLIRDELGWWWSTGSAWQLVNQVTSQASLTPETGWSFGWGSVDNINGQITLSLNATRTGGTLPASTPVNLTTIPAGYRPPTTKNLIGYLPGGTTALGRVNSAGIVSLAAYGGTGIDKDDSVSFAQASWAAA